MAQNNNWADPREILEFGGSTVKTAVKQVAKTINPLTVFELLKNQDTAGQQKEQPKNAEKQGKNHTDLNFAGLKKKYDEQDKQQLEMMRKRLFNLVKTDEQKAIEERKKEAEERKKKELYEQEQKKRKQEEAKKQEQQQLIPQGKVRKTIRMAHKKKAMEMHAEVKANAGKN